MISENTIERFPKSSRIWVYQASRELKPLEVEYILSSLKTFVPAWTAHDQQLSAHGWVSNGFFLFLMVDESQAGASGCSIDSSVAFIRALGEKLNIDWFNRLNFVYKDESDKLHLIHKDELPNAYQSGVVQDHTIFMNTLINQRGDIETKWEVPLKDSWHYRFVS